MIDTFVYGTPRGFDFHEAVASLNDYFMGFYVSTRQGERLTVNRRDDGTTIYSYLCYGLLDMKGRRNAFFGCSVMLDRGQFCPDLKVLFDWFDYLFGRIVERRKVFRINDSGQLQYLVNKFKDAEGEIEWLKANMPNIFKSKDVSLMNYDSSFTQQNTGKVLCCNIDTPTVQLVDDFRRYNWLSVSTEFAPEPVIEISFTDLETRINDYNQQMVGMAINPTPDTLPALKAIETDCHKLISDLDLYSRKIKDESELKNFHESRKKYSDLLVNVRTLISRIETAPGPKPQPDPPEPLPEPPTPPVKTRVCCKCHIKKPITEFTLKPDVCDVCARAPQPGPAKWWERINPLYMAFAVVAVIGIISLLLIAKDCNGDRFEGADSMEVTDTVPETVVSGTSAPEDVSDPSGYSNVFDQTVPGTGTQSGQPATGQQIDTQPAGDKPNKQVLKQEAAEQPQPFTITVVNTDNQGKKIGEKTIKGIKGSQKGADQEYEAACGTYVEVTIPKGMTYTRKSSDGDTSKDGLRYKVEMKKGKPVTVIIEKNNKITIRPVENETFKTDI